MSDTIISVERLSKRYKLGQIGATTLRDSVERWWNGLRKAGQDHRHQTIDPSPSDSAVASPRPDSTTLPDSSGPRSTVHGLQSTPPDPADLWALRDVSFEVKRGEVLGIIGRNGAGKSTLLKILSRITEPTSGRAIMRGRVASLLEVGTGFHPELTGRENIYLNGSILGMRHREITAKFDEIVAFAEVEKFIDTPVKRYSSGMHVRLAFAVAAHLDPEILLVDEVLAVGDASFQRKCLGKMEDVAKHGRTVLFVSHNMIAIQSLCNRCLWLDAGEERADGVSAEVVADYLLCGQKAKWEQSWTDPDAAPGTREFRIRSVRICNDGGQTPSHLDMTQSFVIETVYEQRTSAGCHLVYHFVNDQGLTAFTTSNRIALTAMGVGSGPGRYKSRCHCPGNFFNSGSYFLNAYIVSDGKAVWKQDRLFMFDIQEFSKREAGYHGRQPGLLRPVIDWDVEVTGRE